MPKGPLGMPRGFYQKILMKPLGMPKGSECNKQK